MNKGRPYSEDGTSKLCMGRTHPEGGEFVPLTKFHFHKTGARAGKPFSVCKPCWYVLQGRSPVAGQVSWDEAWPVFHRLEEHLGSGAEVARRMGRQRNWLYEIRKSNTVRRTILIEAQQLLSEIEALGRFRSVGEAEVVRAEPLATILREWIVEWLSERPTHHRGMGRESYGADNDFMGPIQWLSEKTEIHTRRVSGIANGEFETVPLSQADLLLTAIGEGYLLATGEITIIPNPQWSMEKWQAYMEGRGCA
jgi:hypothetical protein